MERRYLGQVGVDSGQLLVIDPCYINSQWKNEGEVEGVKFWGEAQENIVPILRAREYEVERNPGDAYFIKASNTDEAMSIQKQIHSAAKQVGQVIVSDFKTASSYDKVCDLTLSREQAGQLNYELGHAGLGVAFSSGLGDGVYDVYGTFRDIPGCGERITKVEIELITDELLEQYNKLL